MTVVIGIVVFLNLGVKFDFSVSQSIPRVNGKHFLMGYILRDL